MPGWTVVLPLKGGPAAKSRLGGPAGLATAIALDCLAAVLATEEVRQTLVVCPDPILGGAARALGAVTVADPGLGLGAAVSAGLSAAEGPTAVLLGDLPALRPADLAAALRACAAGPAPAGVFVPDAEGTGTVLLAGRRPGDLRPRFGPGSAALHAAGGAVRLELDLPGLRRDVDTPADLAAAIALGLGPRSLAALQPAAG